LLHPKDQMYEAMGSNTKWDSFFDILSWHLNCSFLLKKQNCKQSHKVTERSTITAAGEFVHMALERVNEGNQVANVLLDMSKAFDRVVHEVLLKKCVKLGICGQLFKL
jgi:hypothetical protein